MEREDEAAPTARPFWQWIALALAPGILSNVVAAVASASNDATTGVGDFLGLSIVLLLAMPLLMIPYLIVLSKPYLRARRFKATTRTGFVIGFWFLNAFLWGASCVLIMSGL